MDSQERSGKPWRDDELDAIVADYFEMLREDMSGRPYIKAKRSAALMARIGRTHRSVEFKHQNISAVLAELGMPWILGYKPKANYQSTIHGAIDRYLSTHPAILEFVPSPIPLASPRRDVFVSQPKLQNATVQAEGPLRRLIRKFDPVERDHRNRALGKAGEAFVIALERRRLTETGRADLARKVRWVSEEDGDGAGYDILSFDAFGSKKLLEVKTTNGPARTPFFLTRNEYGLALERPKIWRIYRVHLFAREPRIFTIAPPLEESVSVSPEVWRASFGNP